MTYRERNFNQERKHMKYAIASIVIVLAFLAGLTLKAVQNEPVTATQPTGTATLSVEPKRVGCLQACRINPQPTVPATVLQGTK